MQTPNCLDNAHFNDPSGINDTPFTTYAFQSGGTCPTGYLPLPSVRIEVKYPAGVDGRGTITLSSGPYYTMHADWFNGWDHNTLDDFVQNCINTNTDCGNTAPTVNATTSAPTTAATETAATTGRNRDGRPDDCGDDHDYGDDHDRDGHPTTATTTDRPSSRDQ